MSNYPTTKKKILAAMNCKLKSWLYMHGKKLVLNDEPTPHKKE